MGVRSHARTPFPVPFFLIGISQKKWGNEEASRGCQFEKRVKEKGYTKGTISSGESSR